MKKKISSYHYVLFLIIILLSCWIILTSERQIRKSTNDQSIPVFDLSRISSTVFDLSLSKLVSDFQIIPLETKQECPIGPIWFTFTRSNIMIGTQDYPHGAKLYRFNKNGRFLNEIGKSGNGPGEHLGYIADLIHFNENNNTILIRWSGGHDKTQVFKEDGTFLFDIKQPMNLLDNIEYWSDSLWISTGSFSGPIVSQKDSFALVFYDKTGEIKRLIPRKTFPPNKIGGYTPTSNEPSLYRYNGICKLYMEGNDTIFEITDKRLIPSGLFIKDKNALPFNSIISIDDLRGKYSLRILSETQRNLIINKKIIKKANINELKPGIWAGGISTEDLIIIFDKRNNKAKQFRIKDDIFGIFPDEAFPAALRWQDNNRLSISIQSIHLLKLLKDRLAIIKQKQEGQRLLEQLKDLKEDSNPVIFTFNIRGEIMID